MPRFELIEGTSSKFWEIELADRSFTTRWGRIGTAGQTKTQEFDDPLTAQGEHDAIIRSKLKKGYSQVGAVAAVAATQTLVRLEGDNRWRELMLQGATLRQRSGIIGKAADPDADSSETHGSDKEALELLDFLVFRYAKSGLKEVSRKQLAIEAKDTAEAVAARIQSNPALEQACLDQPDNPEPWRVYADWLQTQGDIRGDLAALMMAGKQSEAAALLDRNRDAMWGSIPDHVGDGLDDLVIRHGFYVGATLKCRQEQPTDLAKLTAQFLALPLARFVVALKFGLASNESNNDWGPTLAAVMASRQAAAMQFLAFSEYTYEDCEISWTPFGDFKGLWKGLPKLEYLHIRSGAGGQLGTIAHGSIRAFIRESGGLSGGELDSIVNAKWPQLERLDVWTGSSAYEAEGTSEQFGPVLAAQGLSKLRHLGIINSELTPDLFPMLASSKLLPQLHVLDLSKGVLGDQDVDMMLKYPAAFAHLKRLDLSGNLFGETLDTLRAAFPNAVLADQRDAEDGEDRYVSVGE